MKTLLLKLLRFYFAPFRVGSKNYYRVRDLFYTNPSEHLDRVVRYAKEQRVSDFDRIIDVGAADGKSMQFFHKHFPSLKIVGYEPNPAMKPQLERVIQKNKLFSYHAVALWKEAGSQDFRVANNQVSSSLLAFDKEGEQKQFDLEQVIEVETKSLDDFDELPEKTLILKLDTQGTELGVLEGGMDTLRSTLFVVTELMNHDQYDGANQYYEVDALLRNQGFKLMDVIVSFRSEQGLKEFDAIYMNQYLMQDE